jgi:hypothetical protein
MDQLKKAAKQETEQCIPSCLQYVLRFKRGAMVFEPVGRGWADTHLKLKTAAKLSGLCPKDKRTKVSAIDEPSVVD